MAVAFGGTPLDTFCRVVYGGGMKKLTPFEVATKPYYAALFDIVSMLTDKAKGGSIDAARELRLMILEQKSEEKANIEEDTGDIKSALKWTQPLEPVRVSERSHNPILGVSD